MFSSKKKSSSEAAGWTQKSATQRTSEHVSDPPRALIPTMTMEQFKVLKEQLEQGGVGVAGAGNIARSTPPSAPPSFQVQADVHDPGPRRQPAVNPEHTTPDSSDAELLSAIESLGAALRQHQPQQQQQRSLNQIESHQYPFNYVSKEEFEQWVARCGKEETTRKFLKAGYPMDVILAMFNATAGGPKAMKEGSVVKFKIDPDEKDDLNKLQILKGDIYDLIHQQFDSADDNTDQVAWLELAMKEIKNKRREFDAMTAHVISQNPSKESTLNKDLRSFHKRIESELKKMESMRKELGAEEDVSIYSSVSEQLSNSSSSSSIETTEIELSAARAEQKMEDERAAIARQEVEIQIKKRQLQRKSEVIKLEHKLEAAKSSVAGARTRPKTPPLYSSVNTPGKKDVAGTTVMPTMTPTTTGAVKPDSEKLKCSSIIDPSLRQWLKQELLTKPNDVYKGNCFKYHAWWTQLQERMNELDLSPSERIQVLRVHTDGAPREAIDLIYNCSDGDTEKAYAEIVKTMNERYGSGPELAAEVRNKVQKFKPITGDNIGTQLRRLADISTQVNFLMPKVPELEDFSTGYGQELFRSKLPVNMQDKWAEEGIRYEEKNNKPPPFSIFCEFLNRQAKKKTHPRFLRISHESQNEAAKGKKDKESKKSAKVLKTEKVEEAKDATAKKSQESNDGRGGQQGQSSHTSEIDLSTLPCAVHKGHHSLDKCVTYAKLKDFPKAQEEILANSIALKESMKDPKEQGKTGK